MRRKLPSIRALESFEAVHRFGNVTRAAEELGRTQSAVSRQIANLEEFVGHELFIRDRKQLVLNESGRRYFDNIVSVLDSLEDATVNQINDNSSDQILRLGVLPTFASRWLMPRMKSYVDTSQPTELHMVKGLGRFDFERLNVDASIECSYREPVGVVSHRLLDEEVVPVISPALYENDSASGYNKLYMPTRSQAWEVWSRSQSPLPIDAKLKFENYSMVIEAACLGFGVAVVPTIYVEKDLEETRLIAPFGPPVASGRSYWLTYPESAANKAKVARFVEWLLGNFSPTGADPQFQPG